MTITCPNCLAKMDYDGAVSDLNATTRCPSCGNPFVPGENISEPPVALPVQTDQRVLDALADIKKELKGIRKGTDYVKAAGCSYDIVMILILILLLYANCTRIHRPLFGSSTLSELVK